MFIHLFIHPQIQGTNNDIRKVIRLISYTHLTRCPVLRRETQGHATVKICVLIGVALCALALSAKPPINLDDKADVLTVFFTGNELGALKPCGCSGGQLGGLDRRLAVFDTAPKQKRLIIDTGTLVETDSEQDLLKFNIIVEAFRLLEYDLVNLTREDLKIAQNLGLLGNPIVGFISPYGTGEKIAGRFRKQYLLKEKYITISVLTLDLETSPIQQIKEVFLQDSGQQRINILIISRCDDAIFSTIAEMGIVDCLVCPSDSDEPRIIGDPNESPLIFSVGRFGRYISKLQIGTAKGKLNLSFSTIPVTENLPQEKSLVELYKAYQLLVAETNLLKKYPRFILPSGLEYTGSESCKSCHEYEYEKWSQKPHSHAYATLERVGSQFDPECAICHVVGMKYESGFVSEQETIHLKNVGCENCHGPGSEHNATLGKAKTTEPKSTCLDCHTPETSSEYAGNEQLYLEKTTHWKEPNTPCNVK